MILLLLLIFVVVFTALFFPQQFNNTLDLIRQTDGSQRNLYMVIVIGGFVILLLLGRKELFRSLPGNNCDCNCPNCACGTDQLHLISNPYFSSDRLNTNYQYKHEKELTPYVNDTPYVNE